MSEYITQEELTKIGKEEYAKVQELLASGAVTPKSRMSIPQQEMPTQEPKSRSRKMSEVALGYTTEQAVVEANRCLQCKNQPCVAGCPVNVQIPEFIGEIAKGNFKAAVDIIKQTSLLPAICGRVCPQESQCEGLCVRGVKGESVAIGRLERFVADWHNEHALQPTAKPESNGHKVAVVGSGPAGLAFASDMIKWGYDVTVYEALHEIGGVLKYGIPEFRLPNRVVEAEIDLLRKMGVRFMPDVIVGKTLSYEDLKEEGFEGIFVASGAGLPRFMNIPGENACGVMSSNEYLTRINLMGAGREGYATPILKADNVAVIGGGNTAMDSARTAKRMGAKRVMLVYRRSIDEMPARREEIHHAMEEGIEFLTLHNPIEYLGDEKGRVTQMRLQKMELGEPDASGRRKPVPVEGAIETVDVDVVVVSVGVSPNPLIPSSVDGLEISRKGTIVVDDDMRSSIPTLFAGGDIVRGGATVILAMGDGRRAAAAMHAQLS